MFLVFEFVCGTPPSYLKVMGWAAHNLGQSIEKALQVYRRTGDMSPLQGAMKLAYGDEIYDQAISDLSLIHI